MYRNDAGEPCGLVYNIQKYTIHDGPGIRTEIFLKGCPLHCRWCSNPEGIDINPQIGVYPQKCVGCGSCVKICPLGENTPISFSLDGGPSPIRMSDKCKDCLLCVDACPGRAIMVFGTKMTVPELMKVILEDRSLYQKTNGGVTVNGGEMLVQWEFSALLLEACRKAGVNTCAETAMNGAWEHVKAVLEHSDLVITDIKMMDSARHKQYTGSDNNTILANIIKTVEMGKNLVIRTPIVPGYNSDPQDVREIGAFIRDKLGNQIVQYQLLPYRKMGLEKYAALGLPYPLDQDGFIPPERSEWEHNIRYLADILVTEFGVNAAAGSGEKLFG